MCSTNLSGPGSVKPSPKEKIGMLFKAAMAYSELFPEEDPACFFALHDAHRPIAVSYHADDSGDYVLIHHLGRSSWYVFDGQLIYESEPPVYPIV